MSATPESLEALLRNLSISEEEPDHAEILKHANHVLKSNKNNTRAIHTRVVALLNLDRHLDALNVFDTPAGKLIESEAILEKAYAQYKLGRLAEAVETTKKGEESGKNARAYQHLAAQAYYRLENFEETARILTTLAKGGSETTTETDDLRVNIKATHAQLEWAGKGYIVPSGDIGNLDSDEFEVTFNAACHCIAKRQYPRSLQLLRHARELCLSSDWSEEEKLSELEPVTAQEIYVLTRTGQYDQALELTTEFDGENVSDEALKVITAVNSAAVRSNLEAYDPYAAWNRFTEAKGKAKSLSARPFAFQAQLLALDEMIIDLGIGKTKRAQKLATEYHAAHPTDRYPNVINAAAITMNLTDKQTIDKIEKLFAENPKDVGLALTLTQLRMGKGNITGSIETMEKLFKELDSEMKYQPGLVGLLVQLYQHQGRKEHVRRLLSEASDWWKQAEKPNPAILRAAGRAKLNSENEEDWQSAGELFTSLLRVDPSDKISSAGFVAAYSASPDKIVGKVDGLTSIDKLIAGIDVDALENAGVAQPSNKRSREDEGKSSTRPPKQRKKKPRLPKDLTKKIDPERWLPMRDRSYYKPKGKKGKKAVAASTQGGPVAAEDTQLDIQKVEQKKPSAGGGGANKKKKKKGGKW